MKKKVFIVFRYDCTEDGLPLQGTHLVEKVFLDPDNAFKWINEQEPSYDSSLVVVPWPVEDAKE